MSAEGTCKTLECIEVSAKEDNKKEKLEQKIDVRDGFFHVDSSEFAYVLL